MVEIEEEIEEIEKIEKIEKNIINPKINTSIKSILSVDPKVYTIDNFISTDDCEYIINISKNNIKQALVSGSKEGYVSQGRSGSNCWIKHDYDDVTKRIADTISELVGIPLENAEAFQVIHYDLEQEYKQHYDGWLFDGSEKSKRNMKFGGQRMVTALAYLNTVPSGGGTKFTRLKKEVKSEKGKLLVFSNVYDGTNKRHNLSEHAGMPIIEGEKWAFNLWFREKSRKKIYDYPEEDTVASLPSSTPNSQGMFKNEEKEKKKDKVECTIDVLKDSSVTFEINYLNNVTPLKEIEKIEKTEKIEELVDRSQKVVKSESHLTSSEIDTIVSLCNFGGATPQNNRSSCWIKNNKIPEIITKISNLINIESAYFENMCVTKYKNGISHNDHLDAYDINSEKGKQYTSILGQRLLTITGFLSEKGEKSHTLSINFPKLNKSYDCESGSILYYNNCFDNTNQRDEKYLKSYQMVKSENLEDIDEGAIPGNMVFNIYVREKSKTNDKVLRLDKGIPKYLNKEEIKAIPLSAIQKQHEKDDSASGFKGCPLTVIDKIYTMSLHDSMRIPGFKMINKAEDIYVMETIAKIKAIKEQYGFLSLENLDENKEYFIDEYNPVTVGNVINPEIHAIVDTYFKENIKRGVYPLGDRQANRYKVLDEIMTRLLHLEFLPLIEKITGTKMVPTYTYLSAYLKGTSLPPHTDRADCEFTCSYVIGKPKDSAWNIYVHKEKQPVKHKGRYNFTPPKDECIAVDCLENGLMMFNGMDHIHFREELEHEYYNIVLLHYLRKGA